MNIVGYADKQTGNPRINMEYSRQRAQKAAEALEKAGIDKALISVDYKGDTVQPFPEDNDRNRVVIITAEGTEKTKEKVVNKKFRTKEVRERIN